MGIFKDGQAIFKDIDAFPDSPPSRIATVQGEYLDGVLAAIVEHYGLDAAIPLSVRELPGFLSNRKDSKEILEEASAFGNRTGMFKSLSISTNNTSSLNVRTHDGAFRIERRGSGMQNLVPMLIAALSAEKGQTLCLEYPENSLSHTLISSLASFLESTANEKGFAVLAATHSPYMLQRQEDFPLWDAEKWRLRKNNAGGWVLRKA